MSDVEKLAAECHRVYTDELRRQGAENRHPDEYEKLLEPIKNIDRALARFIIKHTDALIAAAYLAAADTMWRVICSTNSPPPHGTNAAKEAILRLTPDAARLALEERDRRVTQLIETLESINTISEKAACSEDTMSVIGSMARECLADHRAAVQGGASRNL